MLLYLADFSCNKVDLSDLQDTPGNSKKKQPITTSCRKWQQTKQVAFIPKSVACLLSSFQVRTVKELVVYGICFWSTEYLEMKLYIIQFSNTLHPGGLYSELHLSQTRSLKTVQFSFRKEAEDSASPKLKKAKKEKKDKKERKDKKEKRERKEKKSKKERRGQSEESGSGSEPSGGQKRSLEDELRQKALLSVKKD